MTEQIRLIENRYERLERITWWNQERLRNARVLVAGAGALGNEILKNLALLGVGHIWIVDFDTIELSNLSRAILFRSDDQGRSKAVVAAERLRAINPDIHVVPFVGDLRWEIGLGVYRRMDLVLAGLDSVGARMAINQICWNLGRPWIDGGIEELSGIMRVFTPPEGACYECNMSEQDYQQLNLRHSCQLLAIRNAVEGYIPTTPTIAAVIGAWQAQEAVKLLHGKPVAASQGVCYQGLNHTFFIVNYQRRSTCLAHDSITSVVELPEASHQMTVGELLALTRERMGADVTILLDREIIYGMNCPGCGAHTAMVQAHYRLAKEDQICPQCGAERSLQMTHHFDETTPFADSRLATIGIPALHILKAKCGDGQIRYFELTGDALADPLAECL
jgi:molybdopterin/thiamine biosynthesis adenylyltransferase